MRLEKLSARSEPGKRSDRERDLVGTELGFGEATTVGHVAFDVEQVGEGRAVGFAGDGFEHEATAFGVKCRRGDATKGGVSGDHS